MRILFATDTCRPEVNGVTTVLATMEEGLRHRGHDVAIVAPHYPGIDPDDDRARRILRRPSVPCPGYGAVRLSWPADPAVRRTIANFRPDVIHAVTEGPIGVQGRRYAIRTGVPLVTSFHTDFPGYAARYLGEWAVGPTTRWLVWFHQAARMTQTPSYVVRQRLAKLGLTRAMVWGRSVDTRLFSPTARSGELRASLGADGRLLVLHVGRLALEKDVSTLIRTFALTHRALGHRVRLCVAGDGPEGERVRSALPFAHHLGFLTRPELARLYASADLFIFPSATETCGLVALEAMASGLPVIGAAAGGIVESIQPGITGYLLPPQDAPAMAAAIGELVDDPSTLSAMATASRAFATGRDWEIEMDALVPIYQSILRRATEPAQGPLVAAASPGS